MEVAMIIAFIAGYAGGLLAGYVVHKKILRLMLNGSLTRKIVILFGLISVVPALFLGTVIGGTYGGGVGEAASISLGYGSAGVPVGLGIGLFVVILLTIAVFSITGMLIGGVISRGCNRNAT